MKNNIPPKRELQEFRVTPECVLPAGWMFSARHFTPGQFVDVCGISKGLGWTGTI
jgi:large subunit ribosomal protein L3